jgi:hypothetical protein
VFEPIARGWIANNAIFAPSEMGAGRYEGALLGIAA